MLQGVPFSPSWSRVRVVFEGVGCLFSFIRGVARWGPRRNSFLCIRHFLEKTAPAAFVVRRAGRLVRCRTFAHATKNTQLGPAVALRGAPGGLCAAVLARLQREARSWGPAPVEAFGEGAATEIPRDGGSFFDILASAGASRGA